jgi:hypothetical protein
MTNKKCINKVYMKLNYASNNMNIIIFSPRYIELNLTKSQFFLVFQNTNITRAILIVKVQKKSFMYTFKYYKSKLFINYVFKMPSTF